jgi:Protein of unknown function (DUF2690)
MGDCLMRVVKLRQTVEPATAIKSGSRPGTRERWLGTFADGTSESGSYGGAGMRSVMLRRLSAAAIALFLVLPATAMSAGAVSAVTCSGYGCDGTSPASTGCSVGATNKDLEYIYSGPSMTVVGTIEMRYSQACQTVWARVTNRNRPGTQATKIFRYSDGRYYSGTDSTCPTFCKDTVGANVGSYGYQLYVGTGQGHPAFAEGFICADSSCIESQAFTAFAG